MSRLVDFYKALHRIPELSLKEYKTSEYIKQILDAHHIAYESVVDTGILVFVKGKSLETIALRADMDALPLIEENDFDYIDKRATCMHACGHDGHMSMLLETLLSIKDLPLKKNVLFIFQPAEESFGGAEKIVQSGMLDKYNVKEVYGIHLWPDVEAGVVATRAHALMAMSTEFDIEIIGKRAHGAKACDGIDAIYIASQLMNAYQSIISRRINPLAPAVLHIGTINGGTARNIVCDNVTMTGTIRTYDDTIMENIISGIEAINQGIEGQYHCQIKTAIRRMYPPVINDDNLVKDIAQMIDVPFTLLDDPVMPSEDFSYYQRAYPGVFFFLGIKQSDDQPPLHSAHFSFDLNLLQKGVTFYISLLKMRGAIDG